MIGIVVYIYFLILGFMYADMLFKNKEFFTKLWIGGIIGNLILMAGIIPFAFIFKFTIISHILLIIAAAVPYIVVSMKKRELCIVGVVNGKKHIIINTDTKKTTMDRKVFFAVVLPIALIICILMFNHILYPKGGNYYTGQSTYVDLQMHMDIRSVTAA